tara:strand:+ start:74 stop:886 length:813 start_codon:yes stop_codon:yes gene_type:complete
MVNSIYDTSFSKANPGKPSKPVGWQTTGGSKSSYQEVCANAVVSDTHFNVFKQQHAYRNILEHVTPEFGNFYKTQCAEFISKTDEKVVKKWKENDTVGGTLPFQHEFSDHTLRYINVLRLLVEEFGDLDGFEIVEIGGGYGGQAHVIKSMFNVNYHIIDLVEPATLTAKYLTALNHDDFHTYTAASIYNSHFALGGDLVISNYALSELDEPTIDIYVEKVVKNCKRGFFGWNLGSMSGEKFSQKLPASTTMVPDDPYYEKWKNLQITYKG